MMDLPQWASHKVIIQDYFMTLDNDMAFELIERLIETRMSTPKLKLLTLRRDSSKSTEFYTNDPVTAGALAALSTGQASRYLALTTDENGVWLPEVFSGDGIRTLKSGDSSQSDPSGPQCDPPRASRYHRSARRIPYSDIDLGA